MVNDDYEYLHHLQEVDISSADEPDIIAGQGNFVSTLGEIVDDHINYSIIRERKIYQIWDPLAYWHFITGFYNDNDPTCDCNYTSCVQVGSTSNNQSPLPCLFAKSMTETDPIPTCHGEFVLFLRSLMILITAFI